MQDHAGEDLQALFGHVVLDARHFRDAAERWYAKLTDEESKIRAIDDGSSQVFETASRPFGGRKRTRVSSTTLVHMDHEERSGPSTGVTLPQGTWEQMDVADRKDVADEKGSINSLVLPSPTSPSIGGIRRWQSERRSEFSMEYAREMAHILRTMTPIELAPDFRNAVVQVWDERDGRRLLLPPEGLHHRVVEQARKHLVQPSVARKFVTALRGSSTADSSITPAEGELPLHIYSCCGRLICDGSMAVKRITEVFRHEWPVFIVRAIQVAGRHAWSYRTGEDRRRIFLNATLVDRLEDKADKDCMTVFIFSCIVHELGHYVATRFHGLDFDTPLSLRGERASPKGEMGEYVERAIFGGLISFDFSQRDTFNLVDYDGRFDEVNASKAAKLFWRDGPWRPFADEGLISPSLMPKDGRAKTESIVCTPGVVNGFCGERTARIRPMKKTGPGAPTSCGTLPDVFR